MDNIQYWKDRMTAKLNSFRSNYENQVFNDIKSHADHINVDRKDIDKEITLIKEASDRLGLAIFGAKELKNKENPIIKA
jgi:hypothetical protein